MAQNTHTSEINIEELAPLNDIPLDRRTFLGAVGAGLLITVTGGDLLAQRRGGRSSTQSVAARLHINTDGTITVMTGKVEEGQGARTQISQAAAEELGVGADRIRLIMADTDLVPDDGMTAGSRTTPYTVPAVRRGAAAGRQLLIGLAAKEWAVDASTLQVRDGAVVRSGGGSITYADLAKSQDLDKVFREDMPSDVAIVPLKEWDVLGVSVPRPNLRDLVTGGHKYPSDITRPGMLYGKVLRPPAYGSQLQSIDLSAAEAMDDVVVVRDGQFVACAAPTTYCARQALEAIAKTASWSGGAGVSNAQLWDHLRKTARGGRRDASVEEALKAAEKTLQATYHTAYIQHTPMEPRAATAEWKDGKVTVWTSSDYPQRAQGDLARALGVPADRVRVIVPDMGGGFGGKHTAEAAEEAARLAKAAGRPVAVHWTREEEFTWAYFRPAALMDVRAGLSKDGKVTAWEFININAGGSAIDPPYRFPKVQTDSVRADSPLRQGAYRCLAATANNFARESFMDELAAAAGADPLEFRMAQLDNPRIRTVLEKAAKEFDWPAQRKKVSETLGVGLACGTEKNSCVAACVEVAIDRAKGEYKVLRVVEAFECGPIQNPANLLSQVQGCILMGLGAVLREEMLFENGRILNAGFAGYQPTRFEDVPNLEIHLVDNPNMDSAGGGETPIIAVAPAVANAIAAATGVRLRSLPLRAHELKLT